MTIQIPLPLTAAARASAETARPIQRLRAYLHAQGRSLLACLEFVADDVGTTAGYLLIDEARRATDWTRGIDRRVERVRALLMLEHLDVDDDAIPAPGLFDDIDGEAVHACCRHSDLLSDLRASASRDGLSHPATPPIPLRPAMRPAPYLRAAPAPRETKGAGAAAVHVSTRLAASRAV